MQNGSMAGKVKVLYDGEEIEGLTRFGDVPLENGTIDVPTFNHIRKVQSGVTTMPEVRLTYETRRNTKTRKFFKDYFHKKEKHDVTIIRCDADGVEYDRELWSAVECNHFSENEFDAGSPTYAQINVTLLPYDITPVN